MALSQVANQGENRRFEIGDSMIETFIEGVRRGDYDIPEPYWSYVGVAVAIWIGIGAIFFVRAVLEK